MATFFDGLVQFALLHEEDHTWVGQRSSWVCLRSTFSLSFFPFFFTPSASFLFTSTEKKADDL